MSRGLYWWYVRRSSRTMKKKRKRAEKRAFTNRRLSENDMYSSEYVPGFSSIPLVWERRSGELKTLAQARVWLFSLPLLIVLAAPDEDSLKFSMLLVFHANSRLHVQYISANNAPNCIHPANPCEYKRKCLINCHDVSREKDHRDVNIIKNWIEKESYPMTCKAMVHNWIYAAWYWWKGWWFCLRPWLITASTNYDVGKKDGVNIYI